MRFRYIVLDLILIFVFIFVSSNVSAYTYDCSCMPEKVKISNLAGDCPPIGMVTDKIFVLNQEKKGCFYKEDVGVFTIQRSGNAWVFSAEGNIPKRGVSFTCGSLKAETEDGFIPKTGWPFIGGTLKGDLKLEYDGPDYSNLNEVCNDNKDNDCDKKIDCADIDDCEGQRCLQPTGDEGICMNSLCVRARKAELGLDYAYLRDKLPIEFKDEYEEETYFKEKVIDREPAPETGQTWHDINNLLIVSPYDIVECEGSFVGSIKNDEISKEEVRNSYIDVQFTSKGGASDTVRCNYATSAFTGDPNTDEDVYRLAHYSCNMDFSPGQNMRGESSFCEVFPKGFEEGKIRSNKISVAKYLYYFVRVNQEDWGDARSDYNEFVSLSNINKNIKNAAKAIFLNSDLFNDVKKQDFLLSDSETETCNVKMSFFSEKLRSELRNIYQEDAFDEVNDRLIFVSRDIMDKYVQCHNSLLDFLIKKVSSPVSKGCYVISVLPIGFFDLFFDVPTQEAAQKVEDGVAWAIHTPIEGFANLCGDIGGKYLGMALEPTYDATIALKQWLGSKRTSLFALPGESYVVIRGSHGWRTDKGHKYGLSKALSRSYDRTLCYEDNLLEYIKEDAKLKSDKLQCSNNWPDCCKDGITAELINNLKSISESISQVGTVSKIIPEIATQVGTVSKIIPEIAKLEIFGSCGASYECPGWPLNFHPDTAPKEISTPKSVMGYLKNQERFSVTNKGPFEIDEDYKGNI